MRGRLTITFVLVIAAVGCGRRGPTLPRPTEVMEFAIPWEHAFPSDILVDDRGRPWFTDRMAQVIGRFDPATREFERFELPTAKSAPYGFVRGPDGALWYAAAVAGRLGRIDPETAEITEVELEGVSGGPHLLAVAGGEVWFTILGGLRGGGQYGRYEPATGRLKVYSAPERFRPYGIAAANGRVWIAMYDGSTLLEVDAETEQARIHELATPLQTHDGDLSMRPVGSAPARARLRADSSWARGGWRRARMVCSGSVGSAAVESSASTRVRESWTIIRRCPRRRNRTASSSLRMASFGTVREAMTP